MKCFQCRAECYTIYPEIDGEKYVQKMCLECEWLSHPIPIITRKALDEKYESVEAQARRSKNRKDKNE